MFGCSDVYHWMGRTAKANCLPDCGRTCPKYQRPQGLTVAQVRDVIEAKRSGSSAKKRHAALNLSTISS